MIFNTFELEDARNILLKHIENLPTKKVNLAKVSGKVLAENIYAPINVPEFRKSPLDGFALRAADTSGATSDNPSAITIIDEVQAGDTRQINELPAGCGVKILTGAPLPSAADVVIRKEDVTYTDGKILITSQLKKDNNVISIGADLNKGELVFLEGELITPYHIGVMASLGLTGIKIYKTPEIGILSTGNELKYPGEKLEFGQIYNSNLHSLLALIKSLGGKAYEIDNVGDDIEKIKKG